MERLRRPRVLPLLLSLLCLLAGRVNADDRVTSEVKAAYVVNFAYFTRWPDEAFANAKAPIELIVFGGDRTREAFGLFDGQQVASRKIRVRMMQAAETIDACHLVYFDRTVDRDRVIDVLSRVGHKPVLTVGDLTDFIDLGGMIEIDGGLDRFRFRVKPDRASQRQLRISSRLLKLAIILDQ